jgi:uncharacterized protein
MFYIIIILAVILAIAGLVFCFLPVIHGPLLSYGAMILLHFGTDKFHFSNLTLIIFGILTLTTFITDLGLPLLGAKWYGVSKKGIYGSIIGMLIGFFLFPPFGFIIGLLIGAVCGELIAGKKDSEALKAGIVTFIGNMIGLMYKISICATILVWIALKIT